MVLLCSGSFYSNRTSYIILRLCAMRNELGTQAIVLYSKMDVEMLKAFKRNVWKWKILWSHSIDYRFVFFPLLLQGVWSADSAQTKKKPPKKRIDDHIKCLAILHFTTVWMPSARRCCITTKQVYYFWYTLCMFAVWFICVMHK